MQLKPPQSLPAADAESAAHSQRVAEFIGSEIDAAGGEISFAEYMHHALYAPGLGYYSAGATKFGAAGDFVTAPEISSVFGKVLARQCAAVLDDVESPSIMEFGAGSGRLAADILTQLAEMGTMPVSYNILEVSADLRQRQQEFLNSAVPELAGEVSWLDRLPGTHAGVIIANEVLDALPVERFVRRGGEILQLCVSVKEDSFVFTERDAPDTLLAAVAAVEEGLGLRLPEGYVTDICTAAPQWVRDLAGALEQGAAFLLDYGVSRRDYYAPERSGGWLRCHFRHHAHNDPLVLPGIQDITAWVDFTLVAEAAIESGLDVAGFVSQSQFLLGGGLDEVLADFSKLPIDAQLKLSREVKLLTLPGEMGENFKCLGLTRGAITRPGVFGLADRTTSL
jgi:SAM-dependent MidA family methyltransferase